MKTPPPLTVKVKRKMFHQTKRHRCSDRHVESRGLLWKVPSTCSLNQCDLHYAKMAKHSALIRHQEMDLFFQLLEDELIEEFLKMDSCYKITDKYLLAMTFVYFKRAHFTSSEYTRNNFFIALYLANTMEEDEEKSRYEIFPWALGKNWRKQFPHFLIQRDKLWARIDYRAAVSRRCCEEVMAIGSSHLAWQRLRPAHHSGARRVYGDQDYVISPRGPSALRHSCVHCNRLSRSRPAPVSLSAPRGSMMTGPISSALSLEVTPPQGGTSHWKAGDTKSQAGGSFCIYPKEIPRADPACSSPRGIFMDWIEE
ncbi:speedy protein A [Gouania willdenowi]|uniref:Speedy protein A n=1 Tax=Gouania willdenowi TaxID=441366 RepID=A0A8C5GL38_GOUWI|nr:speedy protein A [Gouania willdenowi]